MVPYLNSPVELSDFDQLKSHPKKPLRVHIQGVLRGVERHTQHPIARIAALFHDIGKLNPRFQNKLNGLLVTGYDHHAYLSALSLMAFLTKNKRKASLGLDMQADELAVLALTARHHGHLPQLRTPFNEKEKADLKHFVFQTNAPDASQFLSQWIEHQSFEWFSDESWEKLENLIGLSDEILSLVSRPLNFWFDTQFSFASLIESDKRDASDNKRFRRDEQIEWARTKFSKGLKSTLHGLKVENELNRVRTQVRDEAVISLRSKLSTSERVFTLTAPTGAGKTFALLALADEIRCEREHLSVIYALPFLSITEQVETICRAIWEENKEFVSRIDSRAQNTQLDKLLEQAETDPLAVQELVQEQFSFETFDAAFIITTFVQVFETLLSNRNSTLLKLPNFSKTIFLLDEFQALPPRLYIFFAAYLRKWCEKFDCYAILSTATMPHLEMETTLPSYHKHHPHRIFPDYQAPTELLDYHKFFSEKVFDRYQITSRGELSLSQLADELEDEDDSCLVILNTIADTKDLYTELTQNRSMQNTKVVLLNTHFILDDRHQKIDDCKQYLEDNQRVILISTQLIEAGVDIDFPIVYRDLCPLPNLIQSAGRCNRNGKFDKGKVVFFMLVDKYNKPRANYIYKHPSDQILLEQTRATLDKLYDESQLLAVQRDFFKRMARNFAIGDHPLWRDKERLPDANLIEYIADFNYPVVGSFRLIDEREFGEEYRLYVPKGEEDEQWNTLAALTAKIAQAHDQGETPAAMRVLSIKLDGQLRNMSGRIVAVRCKIQELPPLVRRRHENWELCGFFCLAMPDVDYSFSEGIKLHGQGIPIL